jgi:hypothetical protein
MTSVLPEPVGALSKNSNSPAASFAPIVSIADCWSSVRAKRSPG